MTYPRAKMSQSTSYTALFSAVGDGAPSPDPEIPRHQAKPRSSSYVYLHPRVALHTS